MFHEIKHIFFDLDHTLWDFDRNSESAFEIVLKQTLPEVCPKEFVTVYVPINQACWKLYQNDLISHDELRYKRLKDSFESLRISVSDTLIHKIADDYITHLPNSNHLFEGCVETLEYLYDKYTLHIITNGFASVQFKKLKNSGIHHFFSTVTNSEMAGVKKPHEGIFKLALSQAQATKQESVMIGDSLDADIGGANNFGIKSILFNSGDDIIDENIFQISELSQLKVLF